MCEGTNQSGIPPFPQNLRPWLACVHRTGQTACGLQSHAKANITCTQELSFLSLSMASALHQRCPCHPSIGLAMQGHLPSVPARITRTVLSTRDRDAAVLACLLWHHQSMDRMPAELLVPAPPGAGALPASRPCASLLAPAPAAPRSPLAALTSRLTGTATGATPAEDSSSILTVRGVGGASTSGRGLSRTLLMGTCRGEAVDGAAAAPAAVVLPALARARSRLPAVMPA